MEQIQSLVCEYIFPPSIQTERAVASQISISKDRDLLAYCIQQIVVLRDLKDLSICRICEHHKFQTTVARFSSGGDWICSGDVGGNVIVWDTHSLAFNQKISFEKILSGSIKDIAWSSDGQRLGIVGEGQQSFGKIIMWDTGSNVGEVSGFGKRLTCVDFRSQRPFKLAMGGDEQTVGFFSGPPFKLQKSFKNHTSFINSVRFSLEGEYLAVVSADRKVSIYSGKEGEFLKEESSLFEQKEWCHQGGVTGCEFFLDFESGKKEFFVTSSTDKSLKIWDLKERKLVRELKIKNEKETSVNDQQLAVSVSSKKLSLVVSVSFDGNFNVFSYTSESFPCQSFPGHQGKITQVCYENETLFSADATGKILSWNKENKGTEVQGKGKHTNSIEKMAFSCDRKKIFSLCRAGNFNQIEIDTFSIIQTTSLEEFQVIDFTPSNEKENKVFFLSFNSVYTFDTLDQSSQQHNFKEKFKNPTLIGNSYFNQTLAVGQVNGIVHLISNTEMNIIYSVQTGNQKITALTFSFQDILAVGNSQGQIKLFDTKDKTKEPNNLTERYVYHTAAVYAIAFSKTGQTLVSGSIDNQIILWNNNEFTKIFQQQKAHSAGVFALSILDSKNIVSAGGDALIKKWKIQNEIQ